MYDIYSFQNSPHSRRTHLTNIRDGGSILLRNYLPIEIISWYKLAQLPKKIVHMHASCIQVHPFHGYFYYGVWMPWSFKLATFFRDRIILGEWISEILMNSDLLFRLLSDELLSWTLDPNSSARRSPYPSEKAKMNHCTMYSINI